MDFSEVQLRTNRKGTLHLGWSGVAASEPELSSTALASIEAALPYRSRDVVWLQRNLGTIARRLHRNLRQGEFGPNRPDQKAMISAQLTKLNRLRNQLMALGDRQAIVLSEGVHRRLSKMKHIDSDAILESIRDADLLWYSETADEIHDICVWLISFTDTNTAARISEDEFFDPNQSFVLPASALFSLPTILIWLDQIYAGRNRMLKARDHGPEPLNSLCLAVFSLAEIFKIETGEAVTSFDSSEYTGHSKSPARKFILKAIEELLPPVDAFPPSMLENLNNAPRILADRRHLLARRVAEFIKLFIARVEQPVGPGRKPRKKNGDTN